MAKHTIAVERDPSRRGAKTLIVDGEVWASIQMDSMGPRGVRYAFAVNGAGLIRRTPPGSHYSSIVYVEGPPKLLNDRLIVEAVKLIGEGLLKSPKAIRAAVERDAAKRKRAAERHEARQYERDRTRVTAILDAHIGANLTARNALADDLVRLIQKARTE